MDQTRARNGATRGERLDSWKAIAAYLKRDIRTVQRWEKLEALPVHRHLHDERGTAYAYSDEIDAWLHSRSRRDVDAADAGSATRLEVVTESSQPAVANSARWPWAIAIGVTVVATVIAISGLSRSRPDPTRLSTLSVVFPPSERIREWGPDTALSPDGSTLAYVTESGQVMVRRIDELTARAVPGIDGAWGPFFSPDGRWIGFNRRGQLMKVAAEGDTPAPLGVTAAFIGNADWGTDGNIVYAATTTEGAHGLYRVPANGGTPQLIAALERNADEAQWLTPQSLANGNIILCTVARGATSGSRFQVVAVSVSSGERRVLVDDARHAMYIGDGVLVYWRNNGLFAARFDPGRVEVTGPHVPAWDDVWERIRMRAWTSAGGTLVYWPNVRIGHRLVWVDRAGKQEPLPLPPAQYHAPRVSPDGRSLAYAIGNPFNSDIWKHDIATGSTVRLTSDGRSAVPLWAPHGNRLIVSWLRGHGRDLAELQLNGTAPEPLSLPSTFLPGASKLPTAWADAGRTLLVRVFSAEHRPAIWAVRLDGGQEPRSVTPSATHAHISRDGQWIAYNAEDPATRRHEVYVAPFPSGRPEWKVSTSGGFMPVWARSGRELFYRCDEALVRGCRGNGIMAVPVTLGPSFTSGTPQLLFEVPFYEGDPGSPNYDVDADDQRFIIVLPATTGGPDRLNVVQGWKSEVLRRLRDSS